MSKVLVTREKLDALVNAYNTLMSKTNPLTLDELATAISEIPTGGGDPSEDLKLVLENPTTRYSIENSATKISPYVFYSKNLETASFPNATTVEGYAFYSCSYLKSINLPKVTQLNINAFYSCSALTTIEGLELCTTIYNGVFAYCSALTEINLPSVTVLSKDAFNGCSVLANVSIPKVREIGQQCFKSCKKLTTLEFTANVSAINASAFNGSGVTKLVFSGNTSVPPLANVNAFTGTPIASGTGYIYVPDALVDTWKAATNWSTYAAQIKPLSELPD